MKKGPSKGLLAVTAVLSAPQDQGAAGDIDPKQRLQQRRESSDAEQPLVDESVRVIPLQVAGCAAEWIVAPGADESTRLLMIHGGGFIMCGLNSHRNTSVMMSKYANCAVLAIDYRLAPETPFPGALDDCAAAWDYLLDNGPQGASEASSAYVMGDSAGGNLAASLLLRLRQEGARMAKGAILMSAALDLTCSSDSWITNNVSDVMLGNPALQPGGPLTGADRDWINLYMGDGDPAQSLASPLMDDLGGLPPLLIMVGENERLRDDSVRFHEKAIAAGVISRLERWPHVYHAWTSVNVEVPEADLALRRMGEFIRRESYKQVAAKRFSEFVDLSDAMAENARRWPHHLAVIEGEHQLSWAQFDEQLNRMANALIAEGIRPNDKVAALARNSLEYMVVMFGTLRAGACIVPLSGMASSEALAAMMDNSDAKVLFLEAGYRELIDPVREQLTGVGDNGFVGFDFEGDGWQSYADFIAGHSSDHPGIEIDPSHGFNIIYSSGTTGVPKGILHARSMRSREFPAGASTGYSPWARTLVSTPLYSNTTMASLLPTMGNAGCAVLMPKFDTQRFLELAEEHAITHAMLVPVQYQRLFDFEKFADYDLSSFLMKYSTSAPLREDLKRRVITEWPGGLIEFYGMTEGGVGCILLAHMFPHKLHTVGFAIPGNQLTIVGEDGNAMPVGEAGEIYGRSRNMMDGYFKAQAKTEESYWYDEAGHRWQRSGDMGRLDADGFLELLDRKKDMIISGGFNVFAADLEDVLVRHEEVNDVAVIAVPSSDWGETPLAIVEPTPGCQPDPVELQEWANTRLGKGQRISEVVLIEELPRSTIGKVLKRELREPFWQGEKKIS
ncbi:steryl acetyl hydrolase [Halieaceae bacterium IMCC14734]|uniref:Steryl acetyl hydrolase n=1 Tax=Candidatus Litorirhabdus singularis TaxID=2518993 RepID=A0ABT3TH29_9GAMM|nr:AMP-binding protein [Candidatus Litorirhabdus singularis]MCX2981626.1 steryl acetyl hydrolase [Candidatus Litorirhabdus singularis]